jgi:hypothetical protein
MTSQTDMSQLITKQGWFGSFNVWYEPTIYDTSGTELVVATVGQWFSFDGVCCVSECAVSRVRCSDALATRRATIKDLQA